MKNSNFLNLIQKNLKVQRIVIIAKIVHVHVILEKEEKKEKEECVEEECMEEECLEDFFLHG